MRADTVEPPDEQARGAPTIRRWTGTDLLLLAGVSLVAAALRLLMIEQWSFGVAEAATWKAVTSPAAADLGDFVATREGRYPLVFLLMRGLFDAGVLPGSTEGWMRLSFAFAGCLLMPLVALYARPLLGRGFGLLAAAAVAVHPTLVEASQTAHPAVFCAAVSLAAGVVAMRGWRGTSYVLVAVAGGCHPLGWLAAAGMVYATRSHVPRLPAWAYVLAALAAAPLAAEVARGPAVAGLALAGVAFAMPLPGRARWAVAWLLPLAAGGVWSLLEPLSGSAAAVLSAPLSATLAAWACLQFAPVIRTALQDHGRIAGVVAAAPALLLVGELLTATFLYFVVYEGGRPAWRAARGVVAGLREPGKDLVVLSGRGVDVLRCYLRPDHWRGLPRDPHPGVVVAPLAAGPELLAEQAGIDGALFVVQHSELPALDAVADQLSVVALWPCPEAEGDGSLYVLRRRDAD